MVDKRVSIQPQDCRPKGLDTWRHIYISTQKTDLEADCCFRWAECDVARTRPVKILLYHPTGHKYPLGYCLDEWARWCRQTKGPARGPLPHFAIAEDGLVIQYMDPSIHGSPVASVRGLVPGETVVIAACTGSGKRSWVFPEQRTAAIRLVQIVMDCYGLTKADVVTDETWRHAHTLEEVRTTERAQRSAQEQPSDDGAVAEEEETAAEEESDVPHGQTPATPAR